MYDETNYFDTHDHDHSVPGGSSQTVTNGLPPLMGGSSTANSNNSLEENLKISTTFSLDDLSSTHHLNQHFEFELDQKFNTHLMQEVLHINHDPNTAPALNQQNWEMQDISSQPIQQYNQQQDSFQCFNSASPFVNSVPYGPTPAPDLLNLLHLPKCSVSSMLPNSSISFTNPSRKPGDFIPSSVDIFGCATTTADGVLYEPPLHLNQPPQPPIFRELLHSLPHSYNLPAGSRGNGSGGSVLFGGIDEREGASGGNVYQDGQFENSVLDFRRKRSTSKGGGEAGLRGVNHFATERQRREQLNAKFLALKELVPNPTKNDRASIVGDAILYIKELLRTVDELKILVEKKRCGRERSNKKLKTEDHEAEGVDMAESSSMKPHQGTLMTDREQSFNGSLRSSWLQRKSKETEVDVRIIDEEVTIKLIQRKKIHCLLSVSRILDELQLDLLHVCGGNIGDYYSFLFNTKIYEGTSVYASAIAKKLIEAVDNQHAAFQPAVSL